MALGGIAASGPPELVATAPTHAYTAALLAAVPEPGRSTAPLEGEPANPLFPPTGCAFHPRCSRATERCTTEAPAAVAIGTASIGAASTGGAPAARRVACHHPLEA